MENLTLVTLAWATLGFFSGAVPYALLVGRWALRADIRQFGDGNPGAANVLRAGGRWSGALAILLDGLKAAIPVGAARWFSPELPALAWLLIAIAPVVGHAWSPFLKFHGGKAVAASFGAWAGLTLWQAPTLWGLALAAASLLVQPSGWALLASLAAPGLVAFTLNPRPEFQLFWVLNTALLAWKYRADLRQRPAWKRKK